MVEQIKDGIDQFKHWIDLAAVGTAIGTLFSWLPHLAAAFTVVWCIYRVKEIKLTIKLKELELKQLMKE